MQVAELPLPSLRSLGLLDFRPDITGWPHISPTLPPLRLPPDPVEDKTDFPHQLAWGGSLMAQTQTPQGQQPPQSQPINFHSPPLGAVPEAGTAPVGTDNLLVPAGDAHPQTAGEGSANGRKTYTFHNIDFIKVNGKTQKREWVDMSDRKSTR